MAYPSDSNDRAIHLDEQDPLKHLRAEFIIPTRADIKGRTIKSVSSSGIDEEPCTYLCGNSLGLQPRRTSDRIASHLAAWAKKGVLGHFFHYADSPLAPFLPLDAQAAQLLAPIVGALADEVAVMETLTANLHLMMASFYRPTKEKYKIILEGKAFPSDHYAVESQILHHGFDTKQAMVIIESDDAHAATISTKRILSMIAQHASTTALILLPGIQYYSGQLFDIEAITRHAHSHGITIGWDLAHAAGNVPLSLHEWDVDFAVWCNYKYLNSGPGAIAGLFVHSRHGEVDLMALQEGKGGFRGRLYGWWGGDKALRFEMANRFVPIPGAQGFQVGNASALTLSSVIASLEVFQLTDMASLRRKSLALTGYLEELLLHNLKTRFLDDQAYHIITPSNPQERGAQLSIQLRPGILPKMMDILEADCVILDERKPDVIRVAPAPLYNTFQDVWRFCQVFSNACTQAMDDIQPPPHDRTVPNGNPDLD